MLGELGILGRVFLGIEKVEIYLHTKFRWHFSIHCWDITTSGLLRQTSTMLEFYFRFRFSLSHHHCHNTDIGLPYFIMNYDVISIFTARHYASAVLAVIVCLSVCLSVCPSVTSRSCTKMAKPRIRLTTPYDTTETLVFQSQKSWRNSNDITPNGGAK